MAEAMSMLEISLDQEPIADGVRRTLRLHRTGKSHECDINIFFDLLGGAAPPAPDALDGYVFSIIFNVMEQGLPVRIHGALTETACRNLHELQDVWACWRPEKYRHVDIRPDTIPDLHTRQRRSKAIAAFSGGVDGSFTAIRHAHKLLGNASYPLTDVLLVHGFDVPLDKPDTFDQLRNRVKPLIDELGLGFRMIRTNIKTESRQHWEDSYSAQLSGCLHSFSDEFGFALIGSGESYSELAFPWGSTPITDNLFGGDLMQVRLDGSGYTRTEKVELISRYPTALSVLKVCWEGDAQDRNCGQCEKCIRTKLNLLAVGVRNPPCFDEPLDLESILKIRLRNDIQFVELKSILKFAVAKGLDEPWMNLIRARIEWYLATQRVAQGTPPPSLIRRAHNRLSRVLGKMVRVHGKRL